MSVTRRVFHQRSSRCLVLGFSAKRILCGFFVCMLLLGSDATANDGRLADAVQQQDATTVEQLLGQRIDVNGVQPDGTTALHWAAHWNDLKVASTLIRAGANLDAANRYGSTPLLLACENGNAPLIKMMMTAGADPNLSPTGEPPIMIATRTGNIEAVRALVAAGAEVNSTETWRGQTALMWAAAGNFSELVSFLIEQGATVDASSPGGFTALLFAAREGTSDATRVLVNRGANLDITLKDGSGALATAIKHLHYELAAYLLRSSASPTATDQAGATPLHILVEARNPSARDALQMPTGNVDSLELMKQLLDAGADPSRRTLEVPDRPTNERAILIDVGVNLGGATPFLLAAKGADVPALRLLLSYGADRTLRTLQQVTPLMVAAGIGYIESNDAGASTESEILETLSFLLDLGVGINDSSMHGQTALHGSVYRGNNAIVRFLVDHGAMFEIADVYGRTPLVLAEQGFNHMGHYRREDQAVLLRALKARQ